MKIRQTKSLIAQAERAFDVELHTEAYRKTHSDLAQLNRLFSFLPKLDEQVVLDLGTGAGYVAMELAQRYASAEVVGLDIAKQAIRKNIETASDQGISNIQFYTYDGINLPFKSDFFDAVFCRYAFHHFPVPIKTLKEIRRVLRSSGKFVFSDAIRSDIDGTDFINRFQDLKDDGHVNMATIGELLKTFEQSGFMLKDSFQSSISFDRACTKANRKLVNTTPKQTLRAYDLSVQGDNIRLRLDIFNGLFEPET